MFVQQALTYLCAKDKDALGTSVPLSACKTRQDDELSPFEEQDKIEFLLLSLALTQFVALQERLSCQIKSRGVFCAFQKETTAFTRAVEFSKPI